ncbi:MAG: zinc ABC transporter substrate-binding protein [Kiritimatiellae bacterium]|nr:zinc ABC transporter substrate-binding protein [Kiritimatiellia bacterium]
MFVSIPPQAWLVKRLAGESVEVQTLLPAGADPHTYEPSARQVKRLSETALVFTLGLPFEARLVLQAGKLNPALKVVAMDAGIPKHGAGTHEHHGTEPGHVCAAGGDPHIWLSPRLLCAMASNTVAALEAALPQQGAALEGALAKTLDDIRETDEAVRARLRNAPVKIWVVYHPSWRYFAEEYGLSLLVLEQDGKAPAARHLAEVIRHAKEAGVKVVFAEPQYDVKPAQTLATHIGARLVLVDPLSEAWPSLMRDVAKILAGD